MSNLITLNNGIAAISENEWAVVTLPASQVEERKQAGKVVLFKLTGEKTVSAEQIANTEIPSTGKIIVPLSVFIARKAELQDRLSSNQIGVWVDTHEILEDLVNSVSDLNSLPIIAVHVERFADGRIFSLGTLLRTRYGFKNELRAIGDVLRDQLYFFKRSGFTSYLIRADRSATEALASLNDFTNPYQGAVDEPRPVFKRYNRVA
ncbi:DUF934 domain-containing protein [Methylotenera versatilis]|jgi:uncharacterized protein (DUF934 family)|uniref:DUF934 domain-containing protein n=1 Tax=Methylotenera versatilis (strain 301) TaxID=666681 RepID=D7DHQ2_METV0|nr:DUF934 domain-containing protein [Methylotenera versatilis]ADI29587.1 conserved hypothetical protein [Methylotenera versatilis 301]